MTMTKKSELVEENEEKEKLEETTEQEFNEDKCACVEENDLENQRTSESTPGNPDLWIPPPTDQVIFPLWCFGFNNRIPVINLSKKSANIVFYASAHLLVIADIDKRRQRILRGHCNEITCLSSSADKRWLASGDAGTESAVIIWDGKTGEAVRTMIEPHKNGVASIALTADARYLATLSIDKENQQFSIWNWTTGDESPLCTSILSSENSDQKFISFKPGDYYNVITNSQTRVIFYHWNTDGDLKYFVPILTNEDFGRKIGNFIGSYYVPESSMAITATSQGLIVVWEKGPSITKNDESIEADISGEKAIKLVSLHDRPITFLTITRCRVVNYCIVTGDAAGVIKFFDTNFMLIFWFQNINAGPIACISFASRGLLDDSDMVSWRSSFLLESSQYPQCSTIPGERFVTEDFILTTGHANMLLVTMDGSLIKYVQRGSHEAMTGLTAHPTLPLLTAGSLTGRLTTYNFEDKTVVNMRDYGTPIQTCKYSKNGANIAVGFTNGVVRIIEPITMEDVTSEPFNYGRGAITHIDFASNNGFCAYSDAAFTTTILRSEKKLGSDSWEYLGRIRAHYRPINDLRFWLSPGSKTNRLFTIGEDQILTEYDLQKSEKNQIAILNRFRIEQMCAPLRLSQLPAFYKEDFILMSTDAAKFKLIESTSFSCRKIVMTHPQGIQYRMIVPMPAASSPSGQFLLCMSDERLALVMLPLDGDPLKCTNLIAHPSGKRGCGKAAALAVSGDGRYVFTAGGPDTCLHMWGVKPEILEKRVKEACHVKRRFYDLLSPQLLDELKDYYYYSMLKTQGLQCLDTRKTALTIPVSEISSVMRAIGYYPTEEEISHMVTEIKYSKFAETGLYVNELDLDTFIQMYCNYRPHQGVLFREVEEAFEQLCHVKDCDTGRSLYFRDPRVPRPVSEHIPPEFLINYLQTIGEPLSEHELTKYLAVLLGYYPEGGESEVTEPIDENAVSKSIDASLPMFFNAKNFAQRMLGMKVCREDRGEDDYYATKLRMGNNNLSNTNCDKTEAEGTEGEAQTE